MGCHEDHRQFIARWGSLIVVEPGDLGNRIVQEHLADLMRVPEALMEALTRGRGYDRLVTIHIGVGSVTDFAPFHHLSGLVAPSRHNISWDDVPSAYDRFRRVIALGHSPRGTGSVSDALHEVGHAAGDILLYNEDRRVWTTYIQMLDRLDEYYKEDDKPSDRGRREFFAEAFARITLDPAGTERFFGKEFVTFIQREVHRGRPAQVV